MARLNTAFCFRESLNFGETGAFSERKWLIEHLERHCLSTTFYTSMASLPNVINYPCAGSLLCLLCLSAPAYAQTRSARATLPHIEYYNHDTYFEKLIRNGEKQDYYTVNTYLNDSSLYRIDNFKLLDPATIYGYQSGGTPAAVHHGPTKVMYAGGQIYLTCEYNMNLLNGPFMVFYSDGSIKRRELYKHGRLREGHCYNPDGTPQPCEPFYQLPEFRGDPEKLRTYLKKKLEPLVDGQTVRDIRIILTINEIGQIIDTKVESAQTTTKLVLAVRGVIQDIPDWYPNESNWKPGRIDDVPVARLYIVHVFLIRGFIYVNLYPDPF